MWAALQKASLTAGQGTWLHPEMGRLLEGTCPWMRVHACGCVCLSVRTSVRIWQSNHRSQSCADIRSPSLPSLPDLVSQLHLPRGAWALPYLLVLLQRNRAPGLMLPVAGLPVFQAILPHWPQSPSVRLQVLG